jgi:excisionase family DNA binding protein
VLTAIPTANRIALTARTVGTWVVEAGHSRFRLLCFGAFGKVPTVKITIEVDDDEIRELLLPLIYQQGQPAAAASKLLTVTEVAERLGVSRSKANELIAHGAIASISIGRSRRIPPAAVTDYVGRAQQSSSAARPVSGSPTANQRCTNAHKAPRASATASAPARPAGIQEKRPQRTLQQLYEPQPDTPGAPRFKEEVFVQGLREKGWPPDLADQIETDTRAHIWRVYVLTMKGVQEYLGISRGAVGRLVKDGKIRQFTIAPTYVNDKPAVRIPLIDVLALQDGRQ